MTCGGCAYTIQSALSGLEGVADVEVDVAAGKAEVSFDPRKLGDTKLIVSAITESEYPATVARELSAEQVRQDRRTADARGK